MKLENLTKYIGPINQLGYLESADKFGVSSYKGSRKLNSLNHLQTLDSYKLDIFQKTPVSLVNIWANIRFR